MDKLDYGYGLILMYLVGGLAGVARFLIRLAPNPRGLLACLLKDRCSLVASFLQDRLCILV